MLMVDRWPLENEVDELLNFGSRHIKIPSLFYEVDSWARGLPLSYLAWAVDPN